MSSLQAQDLTKTYRTDTEQSLTVIADAGLSLSAGESVAIVGPSGSGKSTLLAMLGTLDRPTGGTVEIAGIDPYRLSEPDLARFRSRQLGFVFQDHHLLPQCTVLENTLVPFLAEGAAGEQAIAMARQLLDRVGLANRLLHRPAQLSGGEKQRVALARALVRSPALVLADEPTGNLDGATARQIADLLLDLQREHQSMLVVVTHSESLAECMQRQVQLIEGRLVSSKPPPA